MYTPRINSVDDEHQVRELFAAARTGWLVTVGEDGVPSATLLPMLWHGDRVIAHMAKANGQWSRIVDGSPALVIATGPQAYVSPSWYAAKAEHGKVVPTWDYSAVQLSGTVTVHQDVEWLRDAVTALTETYETGRVDEWHVTDAPEQYVNGQLGGIVGIEVLVNAVQGKAKFSQNRSEADRRGVVDGLRGEDLAGPHAADAADIAAAMARALD